MQKYTKLFKYASIWYIKRYINFDANRKGYKRVRFCFGSRGSKVRILLPRRLKIKELQNDVTPFFMEKPKICTQFARMF